MCRTQEHTVSSVRPDVVIVIDRPSIRGKPREQDRRVNVRVMSAWLKYEITTPSELKTIWTAVSAGVGWVACASTERGAESGF